MLRGGLSAILIVASAQAAQLMVPHFFARTDLSTSGAEAVAIGDVNNDGILDIVTSDDGEVFLGNGDGTFGPWNHQSNRWWDSPGAGRLKWRRKP